ncbi:unnamed protein product [Mytilus coruscus]|uniref:Uncharacterized protein n=1 Tax=Mytilus coruscus TaxID=42192 RepID=A0A6J8C0R4_MYTCO|nr:unnamed protein product [Mytilus coruscus]
MTRHLSVNQVLNQIDDEDNDNDSTSMETAPYSSTPVRQTITAAVHRGETPLVQSARRYQEPVARMLNRPASTCATTPSTRHPVTSTPSPNMSKGTSSTQQLLLKVLENQQEILKRIKTIEMENAVKVGYKEGVQRGLKWQFEGKRCLVKILLTKRQEETAIKKDRLEGEKKRRAAYERKKEKAKRRLSALEKMELSVTKKAKIMEVMKPAYMSSDEENGQDGFITHQPSWQSSKFQDYKSKLDNAYKNVCSKASLRLLQKRTIGNQSQKDVPQLAEHCQWIVRDLEPQNIGNQ